MIICMTRTKKSTLSPRDLAHFRDLLLAKRAELIGDLSGIESEANGRPGDLSRVPIHMADKATDEWIEELSRGLAENERRLLLEINDALERIENGTYGACEMTGRPISRARLEAEPWARYALAAQKEQEARSPAEPERL